MVQYLFLLVLSSLYDIWSIPKDILHKDELKFHHFFKNYIAQKIGTKHKTDNIKIYNFYTHIFRYNLHITYI